MLHAEKYSDDALDLLVVPSNTPRWAPHHAQPTVARPPGVAWAHFTVTANQWRRQLWGAHRGRVPLDFQLVIFEGSCTSDSRVDSYSNSTRKVDIVQCGARSGASGWYWQDCREVFSARRQSPHCSLLNEGLPVKTEDCDVWTSAVLCCAHCLIGLCHVFCLKIRCRRGFTYCIISYDRGGLIIHASFFASFCWFWVSPLNFFS